MAHLRLDRASQQGLLSGVKPTFGRFWPEGEVDDFHTHCCIRHELKRHLPVEIVTESVPIG